jgi:2-iminobutanoate/2-iminopropanoate deaminase
LAGKDVASQTKQTFANMQAILQAAGSDLQYVLKCGVFLIDMEDFSEMNQVYGEMFGDNRPARSTVQVRVFYLLKRINPESPDFKQVSALPGDGLRVEIDCIAYVPE